MVTALIFINLVLVVLETNFAVNAEDGNLPLWLDASSSTLSGIYVVELIFRLYIHRCAFFRDISCLIDLLVIFVDGTATLVQLASEGHLPFPIAVFRVARVLKILRAVRVMQLFPELHLILTGIFLACKSIFWGVFMIALVCGFWAVLAVNFIHPINMELTDDGFWNDVGCERCPRAYSSVQQSMLTFFQQVITGDAWGEMTVPLIEKNPATVLFFVPVYVTLSLTIMNLMLAIIVDKAGEARKLSLAEAAKAKEKDFKEAASGLYDICRELDEDNSGMLSFKELLAGFHANDEFAKILNVMDIRECDLEVVFAILDTDGNGNLHYKEFVEQLYAMKSSESHTLLVFIKFYVMDIRQKVNRQYGELKQCLTAHLEEAKAATPRGSERARGGAAAEQDLLKATPCSSGPPLLLSASSTPSSRLWSRPGEREQPGQPAATPIRGCAGGAELEEMAKIAPCDLIGGTTKQDAEVASSSSCAAI